jgi:hypothetical protein
VSSTTFQNQDVIFSSFNGYNYTSFSAPIENIINPDPKPEPKPEPDGKELPWWAILLIVLGSLAFVGAGVFAFLKYRKRRQENESLLGMKVSLQQQAQGEDV